VTVHVNANWFQGEWTDEGAVITVTGFEGVSLSCPRCGEELPRGEHRCGDMVLPQPAKKARKKS
jgi:hypothetical protein